MADRHITRLLQPCLQSTLRRPSPVFAGITTPCLVYNSVNLTRIQFESRRSAKTRAMSRNDKALRDRLRKEAERKNNDEVSLGGHAFSFLLPGTFVAPPISQYPKSQFLSYAWHRGKNYFIGLWNFISITIMSQPTFIISKPQFKWKKGAVVPAAKALHLTMNESLAAGDKETLRSICTNEYYDKLAEAIDIRPKGSRTEWELVKYTNPISYPRLADDKMGMVSEDLIVRQAVISIASIQRIARYNEKKGGAKIPGSEKLREMKENLVLVTTISKNTWEQGTWKIWGTLPVTKLNDFLLEEQQYKRMAERQGR